jgi:FAD-dependent oxidoreductase domain-containing protein 1
MNSWIPQVDTVVVGAGLLGSSVAMHLAQKGMAGPQGVRVLDFDLEGTLSSSELNAGGVRATWVQPINIELSKDSIEYFAQNAEDVGYRACGYLWLHPEERLGPALKARERQVAAGWEVQTWDVAELRRRIPFLDKTDGIAGALFAPRDGLVNSNLLKNHFRTKAREHSAVFEDRVLLRHAELEDSGSILLEFERFERHLTQEEKVEVLSGRDSGVPKSVEKIRAKRVVNCAGPWAAEIAKILKYPCPSFAVRRQISLFDCRDVDLTPYGMIVDTSGVYFHPEATNGLSGFATPGEPAGVNYHYDGEEFFMERIWPALYERSTAFERLRHIGGWAGLYECSPDESAILGRVEAGQGGRHGGIYEAHSFSGHGAMHSFAAGRALAELLISGRYETIDASILAARRFETGQLVHEGLVI